jgi:hypothetical protein
LADIFKAVVRASCGRLNGDAGRRGTRSCDIVPGM